ncbi:matrixin family metalloprotease [Myxococcus sp. AM001]|nr:matrixin family metalloprotease [Myxococcus sp. AM001]
MAKTNDTRRRGGRSRGRTARTEAEPQRSQEVDRKQGRKSVGRAATSGRRGTAVTVAPEFAHCALKQEPERVLPADLNPHRVHLIRVNEKKWANGTVLHYYFFDRSTDGENVRLQDGGTRWIPWTTTDAEKDVVREAFRRWKQVGIGLEFEEVKSRSEAELRIGFMRDDGAWSFVGRDVLRHGPDERTMNFGWDLTESSRELDTAIHEIGHSLGFPHEHQNPNAGIVWDEEAVYAALAKPPNRWSRQTTFFNIIRQLDPTSVEGSTWDPDSVMHYPFGPGLIKEPRPYFDKGLHPKGGISDRDREWVKRLYPPIAEKDLTPLQPFQSVPLALKPGQQRNFTFTAPETREFELRTFGTSDTVMVLFDNTRGAYQFLTGADDSGQDVNAALKLKLFQGREYVLRVRMFYEERAGESAVMLW